MANLASKLPTMQCLNIIERVVHLWLSSPTITYLFRRQSKNWRSELCALARGDFAPVRYSHRFYKTRFLFVRYWRSNARKIITCRTGYLPTGERSLRMNSYMIPSLCHEKRALLTKILVQFKSLKCHMCESDGIRVDNYKGIDLSVNGMILQQLGISSKLSISSGIKPSTMCTYKAME